MAVAFDASATTDTASGAGNTSPIQVTNLTISAAGTAVVGILAIAVSSGSLPVCTGMTWNGVAMTQIGSATASDSTSITYAFGLASPATGNHTLSATFTGSTANSGMYLDAFSWSGTDLTTANAFPAANVITDATTPTGTNYPTTAFSVTTANGDAAFAAMNSALTQFPTTTGTLIRTDGAVNGNYTGGYKLAVGNPTTLQFTGGASGNPACGIAVRVQQPQSTFIGPDRYMRPLSEPVRSLQGLRAQQPFASSFNFVPGVVFEFIPPSKYMQALSEPQRQKPGLHASRQPFQSAFTFVPGVVFEFIPPSKYMQALSEPVRSRLMNAALQQATPFLFTPAAAVEFIGPDKYMQRLSEPVRRLPGLGAPQPFVSAFTFVPGVVFEFVGPDKYMQALSEPQRQRAGLSTALQQFFTTDTATIPITQLMPWFGALSEPVRSRQGLQPSSQQAFTTNVLDPNNFANFGWFAGLSQPVWPLKGLGTSLQQFFTTDTAVIPITKLNWFAGLSEPVRQKQRLLEAAQQFFAGDTQPIPASLMVSWFEALSDPVRLKNLLAAQQAFEAFVYAPSGAGPPAIPLPLGFPIGRFPIGVIEGAIEFIGPDKWMQALTEPQRQRPGLLTAAQAAFFMEPAPVDVFIRWYQQLSEPQRNRIWLLAALQQAWTGPIQLRPTPNITAVMNAIEQFDAFLGGASVFNKTTSAETGVIEKMFGGSESGVIGDTTSQTSGVVSAGTSVRVIT